MTPVGARSPRRRRVVFPKRGFQRGSAPLAAREHSSSFCFLTFTQLSLVADDCKKLLVESMNAFLEPIRDRRKALDKDPKLVWDMLEAGNAKARAGPRGIWMRSRKKAELYLLEKAGRCLRRRGLSPRTPTWKTMTPVGARSRAPTGVIVFPNGVSKGAQPLWPPGILLFAS